MKLIFQEPTDCVLRAVRELQSRSQDGCFSPAELAHEFGVPVREAIQRIEQLEKCDLSSRLDDDWATPRSGYERCILNKLVGLTEGREYEVLGIEADCYRILNDNNEPVLYPPVSFRTCDSNIPDFWVTKVGEDGECYLCPEEWNAPGFFEDWHDGVAEAKLKFDSVLMARFAIRPTGHRAQRP